MRTNNLIRITIVILAFLTALAITISTNPLRSFITTPETNAVGFLKQNEYQESTASKISTKQLPNDKIVVYQWECNDSSWEWQLELPGNLYNYSDRKRFYKNTLTGVKHDFLKYVTDEKDDAFLNSITESITSTAEKYDMTELEKLNFIISFVQSIPYKEDQNTRGVAEFPRFPIQTLWDGHGDCEDTAILLSSLLNAMGYNDNILISSPNHVAVGLAGDFEGEYFTYKGKNYYYIETTGEDWMIGEKPDNFTEFESLYVEE